MQRRTVILSGTRTPFGKHGDCLESLSASNLGAIAVKASVDRIQGFRKTGKPCHRDNTAGSKFLL